MARKEVGGVPLSADEHEKIFRVAALGEHNLLVFRSLSRPELELSEPDPVPKVVDVAGGPQAGGFLLSALGEPLEFDLVVPFYGRRQIVMGATYSYYELKSPELLDDEGWRKRVESEARPAWVAPFVSPAEYSWKSFGP